MKFIADFHIHSRYSRATAKNLDLENLYMTAQKKGLTVIGTGDFTHPDWWAEIRAKLLPARDGEGLFELRPDIANACDLQVPGTCRRPVRFMLVTEISNIYKKNDRTRKNHNLVFMPDMDSVEKFNSRLDRIGNIASDGRPILGLDARNLLEIMLETNDRGYLIPAHVWTPWFSLLGSKSGFDSVEACFEDLTPYIFALETGLSSDPAMNWRVTGLDRYTLVSNSDAHSPAKLGREANRFDTELSYGAIRTALETADPATFLGTYEFYPEEGKYHIDGHRKCGFRCSPQETSALNLHCPECGKPLTLGVLHRVESLANRPPGRRSPKAAPFKCLLPLDDILSEVLQVGAKSKKVVQAGERLIHGWGSELEILCRVPREDLDRCGIVLFAEAIDRMRSGRVKFDPGYDGEFGKVRIFDPEERRALIGQRNLFNVPDKAVERASKAGEPGSKGPRKVDSVVAADDATSVSENELPATPALRLNDRQQAVVDHRRGNLCIIAGPGTGKTRTITCRMSALMEKGIDTILAVTFTHKAADEMRQRIAAMQDGGAGASRLPVIATFHGFCWQLLQELFEHSHGAIVDDLDRTRLLADAVALAQADGETITQSVSVLLERIVQAKQQLLGPNDDLSLVEDDPVRRTELSRVYVRYQDVLKLQELFDFEDLILEVVNLLRTDGAWCKSIHKRFTHIFVDEFQDINFGQYHLLRALTAKGGQLCVIGDPDQSIYGFRGSDVRYFQRLIHDYPDTRIYQLNRNYRSTATLVDVCYHVIRGHQIPLHAGTHARIRSDRPGASSITIIEAPSPRAEAVAIGQTIERMVGGIGFHSVDFDKLDDHAADGDCSFGDFAILCRTGDQTRYIAQILMEAGIPCQLASRDVLQTTPAAQLLAALKVVNAAGTYADLSTIADMGRSPVSRSTLAAFKLWAYARQLPLATAMHAANRFPIPGLSVQRQQRLAALVRLMARLHRETASLSVVRSLGHIVEQTRLSGRIDAQELDTLSAMAVPFGNRYDAFIAALALCKDTDYYQPQVEKVCVMTLHASKGLEFPMVFVAGCEDGLIPYRRVHREALDLNEERRLFYVAMTRAQERLFLTRARKRTLYGKTAPTDLSPFISDIDAQLIENHAPCSNSRKSNQKQLSLF